MAKYIDVKITLEKTMKVDNDNLQEALKIAKNEYPELELTPEWLDARNVTIEENLIVNNVAEKLAELFHENFDDTDLKNLINIVCKDELKDYIYYETIDILKNKYHIDNKDIKV